MTSKRTNRRQAQNAQSGSAKPIARKGLPGAESTSERLCWRFTHVDHDGRWGFDRIEPATLCRVLRKLGEFESMTVREVFLAGGYPGKEYDVSALPLAESRDRLGDLQLSDMTKINVLRIGGAERLYGFLHDNVFHVVWWDPGHEIWPSTLRHT
jgi:hypothetical protein